MDQKENGTELQAEVINAAEVEDENLVLYKWLIFAVFVIWIVSFLMF